MQGSLDASLTGAPATQILLCRMSVKGFSAFAVHYFWTDWLTGGASQVWTFLVSDATFKTSATGSGSTVSAPELHVDKVKIIAVRPTPPAGIPEACFSVTTKACLDSHRRPGRLC